MQNNEELMISQENIAGTEAPSIRVLKIIRKIGLITTEIMILPVHPYVLLPQYQ